ncbi:MAG: hypothetical protein HY791_24995 [Deltaproteobacteria bacterium]|nr:hypothetical protein [Deltaproteobacteria bacterium]
MSSRLGFLAALLLSLPATGAEPSPSWSEDALEGYFRRSEAAQGLAGPQQLDELTGIAGMAYAIPRNPGEGTEGYARRILKTVEPSHPEVAGGYWVKALIARFYRDAGERAERLSRFSTHRTQRVYLEKKGAQAKAAAQEIAAGLRVPVDGVEGGMEPLPVADAEPITTWGATVAVMSTELVVEGSSRATLVNGAVSPETPRTTNGTLREVKAALDFFQRTAATMGLIDPMKKKGNGIFRIFIPGRSTAELLNEVVKAAIEAKMHTLLIMTTNKAGKLNQITAPLNKAPAKKKSPATTDVKCRSDVAMQACVEWILEQKKVGPIRFVAS